MTLSLSHPLTQARYQVALRSRLLSHYNRYLRDKRGVALGKLSKAKAALRAVVYRMQGKPLPVKPVEYDLKSKVGGVPVGVVIESVTPEIKGSWDEAPEPADVEFYLVTTKGYPLPDFINEKVNFDDDLWDVELDIWAHLRAVKQEADLER